VTRAGDAENGRIPNHNVHFSIEYSFASKRMSVHHAWETDTRREIINPRSHNVATTKSSDVRPEAAPNAGDTASFDSEQEKRK